MAEVNTSVLKPGTTGLVAGLGNHGCTLVRVTLDGGGAGDTTITLPSSHAIKNITSVIVGGPGNLAAGTTFPVAATTGFLIHFIAANNAGAGVCDVLIFGKGA